VESLGGIRNFRLVAAAGAARVVVGAGVDVGVDDAGLVADEFHDVDFAAGGPADLAAIDAERPDGRPGAAGAGDLGADFKPSVGPRVLSEGVEGGGGVVGKFLGAPEPAAAAARTLSLLRVRVRRDVIRVFPLFLVGFDD
jgi:hypothetical protein